MRKGKLKSLLYNAQIIPSYTRFLEWRYQRKVKRSNKADRWYFGLLPVKKNKVIFDNFLGRGYGDNPKAIAEEIIRQNLHWDMVWLTNNPEKMPSQIRQVKYGSPEAMREMATAKMWIFNCRNVKHPKKRSQQKYLQTWHGSGATFKAIEGMAENLSESYIQAARLDGEVCDYILSYSQLISDLERKYFWLSPKVELLEFGCPSGDFLFNGEMVKELKESINRYYHIEENEKIILYMPTFRDDSSKTGLDMDYKRVIDAFESRFNSQCLLMIRLHPNVSRVQRVQINDKRIIDVSQYPDAVELFAVADFCITDYSGGVFYGAPAIRKITFLYASDYDSYKESRGFIDTYEKLPLEKNRTNDELLDAIMRFDADDYRRRWERYLEEERYFNDGYASKKTVDFIKKHMGNS